MKKAIATSLTALVLASSTIAEAQVRKKPWGYIDVKNIDPAARIGVLTTNLFINGTICGITALVEDRDGLKDIGQCFAGTALQYAGMEIGAHAYDIPAFPGFAYRLTETGTSIVESTLAGRGALERLHLGLGPGLLQIDTKVWELNFLWRLSPLIGIGINIFQGNEFSIDDSLSYQIPVFHLNSDEADKKNVNGYTVGNVLAYNPKFSEVVKPHEFVHITQYVRSRPFQLVTPDFLDFLEEKLHYRAGEDVLMGLLSIPTITKIIPDIGTSRTWYNIKEAEAYIIQTKEKK